MKVILTKCRVFAGKKDPSKSWVSGNFVSLLDGSTGDFLLEDVEAKRFGFDHTKKVFSVQDLKKLSDTFDSVDVEFDQRGRVVALK